MHKFTRKLTRGSLFEESFGLSLFPKNRLKILLCKLPGLLSQLPHFAQLSACHNNKSTHTLKDKYSYVKSWNITHICVDDLICMYIQRAEHTFKCCWLQSYGGSKLWYNYTTECMYIQTINLAGTGNMCWVRGRRCWVFRWAFNFLFWWLGL